MGVSGGKITELSYAIAALQDVAAEIAKTGMSGRRSTRSTVGAATHILCVGEDQLLLNTRRSILEREGYTVLTSSARELPVLDVLAPAALVIVCHSVEGLLRLQLIGSLQGIFPCSRILLLEGTSNLDETRIGLPRSSARPEDFLNSVADLIARIHLDDTTWTKPSCKSDLSRG
jgi:hypothetical protein